MLGRTRWMLVLGLVATAACATDDAALVEERDALKARTAELKKELDAAKRELAAAKRADKAAQSAMGKGKTPAKADADRPDPAKVAETRDALGLGDGEKLKAAIRTNLGEVSCELWPDIAPVTVSNFVGLAEGTKDWKDPKTGETKSGVKLYDGTIFHRVIGNFMIQGGDPLGSGRGGPGYRFEDEVWPDVTFSKPGLLAMANSGPATNGSQFFITTSTPMHLNMRHTIFGSCDMKVVKKIASVEVGGPQRSTPVEPVVIETIAIERG